MFYMPEGQGYYSQLEGGDPRLQAWKYDGWKYGQNSYSEDNEIRDQEWYDGVNIELQGRSSIRMPRRGSQTFTSVSGASKFNGWGIYRNPIDGSNFMVAMYDGLLYKITAAGVVTEIDNTKTWDDEAKMRGILLRENFYFGNAVDYMSKTDGDTVTQWTGVTAVTLNSVVLTGSGATDIYEYGTTAITDVGETEISNTIQAYGPSNLDASNKFTITWDRKTDANVRGYNIYKAKNDGTMTLLTYLDQQASGATLSIVDDGTETQSLIYEAPTFNTTGGVKGNIFAKYANSLFVAGNLEEPDTVFYGGTGSNWESFSPAHNGGWVKPGRGDGDKVTAMIGFEDFLFIFKENSIWKFVFGSDGGPTLTAVIPQYGTSSPDSAHRMEKDIVFLGSDGRYRIIGYEPNQLNVIRTTDISNRIQPKLDALDKSNMDDFFASFYEQKFIVCNGSVAYPYDRRYTAFLGKWTNYNYQRFLTWDKTTGQQKLFAAKDNGVIEQILVDNTYEDNGVPISASLRVKRVDGGEDTLLKYFHYSKIKLKNPRGRLTLLTYKDGSTLEDQTNVDFDIGGGIDEYMFDEPMFDESVSIESVSDAIQILKKELYFEAYSIYHQINVAGSESNHFVVQTMNGLYEFEDVDYDRDETIV